MNNPRTTSIAYFVHCVESGVKTYNMHPHIYARCKHCNPDARSTVRVLYNSTHRLIKITYRHGATGKIRLQRFNAIVKATENDDEMPPFVVSVT